VLRLADWRRIMRWIRTSLVALCAALALSAAATATASAFHPLFLTHSGRELLFTAKSGFSTPIKALVGGGNLATWTCEEGLVHGLILNKSTLIHRLLIEFHRKCETTVGASKTVCEEPIKFKEALGELGLLSSTNHKVVLLLIPSDGTKEFLKWTCELSTGTLGGAVIGEFPLTNTKGVGQYDKQLTEAELVFATESGNNEKQKVKEIFLLGIQMTGVEMTFSGFFVTGAKSTYETTDILKPDGSIEISTH
jgi:hypothetical protein